MKESSSKPAPHADSSHTESLPGEDMNVRGVHEVIVRELPEPRELYRKIPWYLRHFYAVLVIWAVIYLLALAGSYDWSELETPLQKLSIESTGD